MIFIITLPKTKQKPCQNDNLLIISIAFFLEVFVFEHSVRFCEHQVFENEKRGALQRKLLLIERVRLKGLEPLRREAPDPKSGVATNYTTAA